MEAYAPTPRHELSPLVIADRLITLAKDAERAGYRNAASDMISLVYTVLDERIRN